jgi:hypothetical protein
MRWIILSATFLLLAGGALRAQTPGEAADHDALRKLKADVLVAINSRNVASMDTLLHKPFISTVITQDSFNDTGKLASWFEGLFNRPLLRITGLHMEAEADELSQIYTGTFAVARGSTRERYEIGDGRSFEIAGRWTATALKENGRWTLLAIHDGTNFLDNPVIDAIERNTVKFASIGTGAGAVVGFLVGFLVRRGRPRSAA